MKRLRMYLAMQTTSINYKAMYDGKIHMISKLAKEAAFDISEPIYWKNDIFYEITRTNRLDLSKPTVTIGIPIKKLKIAEGLINGETKISQRGIPAADYYLRVFKQYIDVLNKEIYNRKRPDKENGRYYIYEPDGKVLRRNCSYFKLESPKYYENRSSNVAKEYSKEPIPEWYLEIKVMVQLPEKKNKKAIQMLTSDLPNAVEDFIDSFKVNAMKRAVVLYNRQEEIRNWIKNSEFCAFIGDGSILPRDKDSDRPMTNAIPCSSKNMTQIQIGDKRGIGIRKGVTVITGGGYSGKSTILDAVSEGIYNHVEGDGREYVITDPSAMIIAAEDGRSVKNVNIAPFIRWIPGGNPEEFSTEHASGSTSQAANIVEAVEYGSKLLLIDEDKSATNFMIRDSYMQKLVQNEPIVPYTDRVQELYHKLGVSTILVIGGSSEYLKVSDHVILMEDYQPKDITKKVDQLVQREVKLKTTPANWHFTRSLYTKHFTSYKEEQTTENMKVTDQGFIEIGDECIDTRSIHAITTSPQLVTIAFMIRKIMNQCKISQINIEQEIDHLLDELDDSLLDTIYSTFFIDCDRWLELPRKYEVLMVIHRMRKVRFRIEKE